MEILLARITRILVFALMWHVFGTTAIAIFAFYLVLAAIDDFIRNREERKLKETEE